MIINQTTAGPTNIPINSNKLEQTENYKYLGSILIWQTMGSPHFHAKYFMPIAQKEKKYILSTFIPNRKMQKNIYFHAISW
jgi:hypothetical protein